jgi:hypothetical protein
MTSPDDNQSRGNIEPSKAAMDECRASRERNIRPGLVFLPMMFLGLAFQKYGAPMVVLFVLWSVGMIICFVLIAQNGRIQLHADRRL